jgi:hypothetical protein
VFEYFVGYKLGLTATPKDYIKQFNPAKPSTKDPREASAACCSTPTALLAANPASPPTVIRCSTA